jgi:hypothetical protein
MHAIKNRHYPLFSGIKAENLCHCPGVAQLGAQKIDDVGAYFLMAEKMLLKIIFRGIIDCVTCITSLMLIFGHF